MQLKQVIDTNIIVSAILKPHSQERLLFNLALSRRIDFYISPDVLEEYQEVLSRKKFKLTSSEVEGLIALIKNNTIRVKPSKGVTASRDASDNRFLECAEEAEADYLVTGNTKDFPAKWKQAKIVTAGELLDLILSVFVSWKRTE